MNLTKKRAEILITIVVHAEVNLFGGSDLVGIEEDDPEFESRIKELEDALQWISEQANKRLLRT